MRSCNIDKKAIIIILLIPLLLMPQSAIKFQGHHPRATESFCDLISLAMQALEPKRKLVLPVLPATVKDSLAAFTASIKQDKSLPEIQSLLVQALADKAVVEENGKVGLVLHLTHKGLRAFRGPCQV